MGFVYCRDSSVVEHSIENSCVIGSSPIPGIYLKPRVGGFEPPNIETKTRCLTTWQHPNQLSTVC